MAKAIVKNWWKRLLLTFMACGGLFIALFVGIPILFPPTPPTGVSSLYENYIANDNMNGNILGNTWKAQTFAVNATAHTVTSVKLKMFRVGSPGTVTVGIRALSGLHPTGSDLTNGTIDGNSFTTTITGAWYEITQLEYTFSVSTNYSIVVRATGGNATNYVMWRVNDTGTYSGGNYEYSSNGGSSWVTYTGDFMFEVWGNTVDTVAPTYSNVAANTTKANQPCKLTTLFNDNRNISMAFLSHNNTGPWTYNVTVNLVWINTSAVWSNYTITVNATVGTVVGWYQISNDTSNIWNATMPIQTFTVTADGVPPTYSDIETNTVVAGKPCAVSVKWTDIINMSGYESRTNSSGVWVNETWTPWTPAKTPAWSNITILLNTTFKIMVAWEIRANGTDGEWTTTGTQYILTSQFPVFAITSGSDYSSWAARLPYQSKLFFAAGLWWVFYPNGTSVYFKTTSNGYSFSTRTLIGIISGGVAAYFSVFYNGTTMSYCRATDTSGFYYRAGIPNADGTISWFATEKQVAALFIADPTIAMDSNGYPWIGYYNGGIAYATKSAYNNGSWTTAGDFPIDLNTNVTGLTVIVLPLTNGKIYFVFGKVDWRTIDGDARIFGRLWNGTALGNMETASTNETYHYDFDPFCAVSNGDVVHVSFLANVYLGAIQYINRTASGIWSSEQQVTTNVSCSDDNSTMPTMAIANNTVYIWWVKDTHIYYKSSQTGNWSGDAVDWVDESVERITRNNCIVGSLTIYGTDVALIYETKTVAPYNLKLAYFAIPTTLTTGWNNFTARTVDVGHTLSEVNASLYIDSINFVEFIFEYANGSRYVFFPDWSGDAAITVTADGKFWILCAATGTWRHEYP